MKSNSTAILIKIKLRHSLGRPSRSDFVQSQFIFSQFINFFNASLIYPSSSAATTFHMVFPLFLPEELFQFLFLFLSHSKC